MALDRYAFFAHQVRDLDGAIVPVGTLVFVRDADTTLPATIYYDNGTTQKTNPVPTDANGVVTFYAGRKKRIHLVVMAPAGQYSLGPFAADTVEDHRLTGDHAAGTIGAEQLDFTIEPGSDLSIHAAMEANTHGAASNEYFLVQKAGTGAGTSSSGSLGGIVMDSASVASSGYLQGYIVADPDYLSINAAIAAANDGDVILVRGTNPDGTQATLNTSNHAILIDKSISLVGMAPWQKFLSNGTAYTVQIDAPGAIVHLSGLLIVAVNPTDRCGIVVSDVNTLYMTGVVVNGGLRGLSVAQSGTVGSIYMTDCQFNPDTTNGQSALTIGDMAGGVFATNCVFGQGGAASYAVSLNNHSTTILCGHHFTSCTFYGNSKHVYTDVENCIFVSCFFNDLSGTAESLNITANATDCYAPEKLNIIQGTITDPSNNRTGGLSSWDYDSGVVDIDNRGATYEDEFFTQAFTHNLGTRQLEAELLIADTTGFDNQVWNQSPQGNQLFHASTPLAMGPQAFSVHYVSDSAARLVLYAGRSKSGGSVTSTKRWLVAGVDSTAVAAGVNSSSYNYTDAGGIALDQIFVRLRLRRMV